MVDFLKNIWLIYYAVGVLMTVDISGTYPQTAPIIALTPIKGKTFVTSKLCEQLLQEVNELAEQNVGMPSIYLLAQHVQVSSVQYQYAHQYSLVR